MGRSKLGYDYVSLTANHALYILYRCAFYGGWKRGVSRAQGMMKLVDPCLVDVVHSGELWEHQQPPCSRHMMRHLEKNEGLVTWVQVSPVCFFFVAYDFL